MSTIKKYLIWGVFVAIILAVGICIQINSNKKVNQNLPMVSQQINANEGQPGELKIEVLKEGTGTQATTGDAVSVHYVGTLTNGTKFDSSRDRELPLNFTLGAQTVIPGWEQGILGMRVGEIRKLTIPYNLAYGETGVGTVIPPKATLIFEVEMLKINGK
jgi:FKBP-type peptidyl-prolyl cis-trans isomerase